MARNELQYIFREKNWKSDFSLDYKKWLKAEIKRRKKRLKVFQEELKTFDFSSEP